MQLYRLPVFIVLLTFVTLSTTALSEQRTLIRRQTTELNKISAQSYENLANNTIPQDPTLLRSPFILLMSSDTISVAQLPMIENGNLTDVYHLVLGPRDFNDVQDDLSAEDDEKDGRDLEKAENESEDEGDETKNNPGADAREYEQQMPKSAVVNTSNETTTSLGKSEWQQIVSEAASPSSSSVGDREEVWPQPQTTPSAGNRKEDRRASGEEGITGPRRRRRARRSNSLNDDDDDGKGGSEIGDDVGSSSPPNNQRGNYTEEVQTKRVNRAEESSNAQNVTSARSASNNEDQQRQPNSRGGADPATGGPSTEEGDDKNRGRSTQISPAASSDSSSTFSQPSTSTVEGVQFCDFDVHMALGYAFVADSTGRIHRFKLPSGSPSSTSIASRTKGTHKKATSDESANRSAENDYMNTIDAGANSDFSPPPRRAKLNTRIAYNRLSATDGGDSNSNNIRLDESVNHSIHGAYDVKQSNAGGKLDHAENASGYTAGEAAQEQLAPSERQHPTVSGGQLRVSTVRSENPVVASDGAPTSGALTSAKQSSSHEIVSTIVHISLHELNGSGGIDLRAPTLVVDASSLHN